MTYDWVTIAFIILVGLVGAAMYVLYDVKMMFTDFTDCEYGKCKNVNCSSSWCAGKSFTMSRSSGLNG